MIPGLDGADPKYLTLNEVLEHRAEENADDIYVTYGPHDRRVSYSELNKTANSIGRSLREMGIEQGDRVSVMMRNPLDTLFAFFGILKSGGVFSPINYDFKGRTLSYQINDTSPVLLLVEDEFVSRLNNITADLQTHPDVVVSHSNGDSEEPLDTFGHADFETLVSGSSTTPAVDVTWHDTAAINYTSGTTGDPKGVVLPHRWIIHNYTKLHWELQAPSDVTHTVLPLFHVAGLYNDTVSALIAGSSVVMWDKFSSETFWDRIDSYGATKTTLMSVMIDWLLNRPDAPDDRENTLNKVLMVPLEEQAIAVSERFGFDIVHTVFGATESGFPMAGIVHAGSSGQGTPTEYKKGLSADDLISRAESLGIPVVEEVPAMGWVGTDWRDELTVDIVDEHDESLPTGDVGELVVRPELAEMLFKRYDGKPAATLDAWSNLWYHHGDALYRDEEGYFYFVDRMGSVIRRRGENISSEQVQNIVNSHEDVELTAAFPVPAEQGGEDEVAIAVEVSENAHLTEADLRSYLKDAMPSFMIPQFVMIKDEIPKTETNKMRKHELREEILESRDG